MLDNYLAKHKRNVARSTYQHKTNFNKFFQQNYVIAKAQNQTIGTKWSIAGGNSSIGSKSSEVIERRNSACSLNARSPFVVDRNFNQLGSPTIKRAQVETRPSDVSDKPMTLGELEQDKKRKTISNTIQKLFKKENEKQNSPIRVSQFLVDVEQIRKKAGEQL